MYHNKARWHLVPLAEVTVVFDKLFKSVSAHRQRKHVSALAVNEFGRTIWLHHPPVRRGAMNV